MRADTRSQRQTEIEAAAYRMLEEKGYAGTSMQGIARRAKASNETLYNWYGDKLGLFRVLVTRNAAEVKFLLEHELTGENDAMTILGKLGPKLLMLLLGDRAIALNRAAAADATGALGAALSEAGRETVLPLVVQVLERAKSSGQLFFDGTEQAVGLYMDLLVGDMQIRRAIGRIPAPDLDFCIVRSDRAIHLLRQLRA